MGSGKEQILGKIVFFLAASAFFTYTAPLLFAEIIRSLAFDITLVAESNHDFLIRNQIQHVHIAGIVHDFRPAVIAKLICFFIQVFLNDIQNLLLICQHAFQIIDGLQYINIFIVNLFPFQTGQALQPHIQDGLGLTVGEAEFFH